MGAWIYILRFEFRIFTAREINTHDALDPEHGAELESHTRGYLHISGATIRI